jgi:hypothetical protein
MNYLKSALAGFGMSFVGTALCGAKFGLYLENSYDSYTELLFYQNNTAIDKHEDVGPDIFYVALDRQVSNNESYYKQESGHRDKYELNLEKIPQSPLFDPWHAKTGAWNICEERFTFQKSFLQNNCWSIPTAILGVAYHDYFGRDVADKFNKYFNTDISPYILDGAVFGAISTLIMLSLPIASRQDLFFKLSMCTIQGFLVGCTAAFGAYCGDETPKIEAHDELTQNEEIEDIDFIL